VAEPVVRAERFTYSYPGAGRSLRDVTLEIEPGTFTVLAGLSGSGKSTLLRALCGLVPHFHGGEASGELAVGGLDVREHGPGHLAAVCGTVFQEPETQVVMGGARAELELPLEHRGEPPAALARAVEETALALGVGHLLERRTDTLSGGELQRVALAAAMVHGPDLLLLDEPTSQLDPVAGDELVWLLRRLNEDWGTAVVMAEHRLERCLPAADRVIALVEGRVACDAPPGDFLAWAAESMPALATPAARLFSLAGLDARPASVKEARAGLRGAGVTATSMKEAGAGLREAGATPTSINEARATLREAGGLADSPRSGGPAWRGAERGSRRAPRGLLRRALRRDGRAAPALAMRGIWLEIEDGPTVLRGLDLELRPGERVALMGRNGAGKSTLLRLAKGLAEPSRGRIERAGEVALLLQTPGDYLIHEHAVEDAGVTGVAAAGLAGRERANPRDLSGGERQRLALEVVLAGGPCAAVLLDEPTRGMDRAHKDGLAERIRDLADAGAAVVVATHDTEFAASFANRVVLLGPGVVIGDGPPAEVLGGGRHFSTEVARVTGGAALLPEDAARLLQRVGEGIEALP
jgi:energy-coupling factor transport system ATP-binding protein